MQTWLWVYSLLKEWVRSRKHCGQSEHLVRGPRDLAQTWTQVTGRGAGHPRRRWAAPHLSQGVGPSEEASCGRLVSAWAKEGVGAHEVQEVFPVAHPAAERASSGGGGEFPVSISIQGGKQVTAGVGGGCKQPLSPSVGGAAWGRGQGGSEALVLPGPPPAGRLATHLESQLPLPLAGRL